MSRKKSKKGKSGPDRGAPSPKAQRKRRIKMLKNVLGWAAFAALLGLVLVVMGAQLDPFKPGRQQEGAVSAPPVSPASPGARPGMEVSLDEGGVVRVGAPEKETFKEGDRVAVQEWVSTIFKKKSYRFVEKLSSAAPPWESHDAGL